jgi:hypothetical protein
VADDFGKYGVELVDFLIGAITPPEEVQKMIDERAGMGAVGDMQKYMAYKTARAVEAAADNPGETGGAAGLGLGAGIGMMMPQMMAGAIAKATQAQGPGGTAPGTPPAAGTPPATPGAPGAAAPPAAPVATERREITPGMSLDEVKGLFGNPTGEVVFGNKTRWSFADITVIFEDGKVTEVKF